MENSPALMVKEVAFELQHNGEYLASAILYTELVQVLKYDASAWTGLGTALAKASDSSYKRPFYEWAARVLLRGLEIGKDGPFASPSIKWLDHIAETIGKEGLDLITDDQFEELRQFLNLGPEVLPKALRRLPDTLVERSIQGMAELANPVFLPAVLAAVKGEFGESILRTALGRIAKMGELPGVRESLAELALQVDAGKYQPALGAALQAIDPAWAKQFGEF